jgi:Icc-related predicted phosphoesterase
MKIACFSDTHGLHRRVKVPDADLLIYAGDFMTDGYDLREVKDFGEWLSSQPHKYKVWIAGNHDRAIERDCYLAMEHFVGCYYLENSGINIEGLKLYGSPVQPEFCNWSFNVPRGPEIRKYWDMIPLDTDILVTHGPPMGYLDTSHPTNPVYKNNHLGCRDLADKVREVKPKLHIFGHIHGGYGKLETSNATFLNVSICDEAYRAVNPVTVIYV